MTARDALSRTRPRHHHGKDDDVVNSITGPAIEHADALDWLAAREPGTATAVIFDPPYAVSTAVRGREDGAGGSVSGPLSFMQRTMSLCVRAKRLPDLMYAATTSGLRLSGCVAWVRTRPGTGGLFRSSWDPILIASRGTPDAVDRAAVRNVIETDDVVYANYPAKRTHPYEKPPEVLGHILTRGLPPRRPRP